jgi:TonB family protein
MRALFLSAIAVFTAIVPFSAALAADPAAVSDADWESRPSFADVERAYPAAAIKDGVNGSGGLACTLRKDGSLASCTIASEAPANAGFGAGALSLAGKYRMKPDVVQSRLARSPNVMVPFTWKTFAKPYLLRKAKGNFYPPASLERGQEGKSVVRCGVSADGSVHDCIIMSETLNSGFGTATIRLLQQAGVRPTADDGTSLDGAIIEYSMNWSISTH